MALRGQLKLPNHQFSATGKNFWIQEAVMADLFIILDKFLRNVDIELIAVCFIQQELEEKCLKS
jgi:hypothetical protein